MSLLYCMSTNAIVHHQSPPLTLSEIPILSRISSAVIIPYLCCVYHNIIFHSPAPFNTVVCLCMTCVYAMYSTAYILYCSQISTVSVLISNLPYTLQLSLLPCVSFAAIFAPLSLVPCIFIATPLHFMLSLYLYSAVSPPTCATSASFNFLHILPSRIWYYRFSWIWYLCTAPIYFSHSAPLRSTPLRSIYRVFCSCPSFHRALPSHRYEGPVQVPPAAAVSVEIFGDGEKIRCLRREVRPPATLLIWCLLLYLFLVFRLLCLLRLNRLFVLVSTASSDLTFVCLRTTTAPDGVPIEILFPIGDVVVSLHVFVGSIDILYRRLFPLITVLLVILIPYFFLLQRARPGSPPSSVVSTARPPATQLVLQMFGLHPPEGIDPPFLCKPLDLQPLPLLFSPHGLLDLPPFGLLGRPLQSLHNRPNLRLRLLPPPSLPLQGLSHHLLPSTFLSLDYPPPLRLGLQRPPKCWSYIWNCR